MSSSTLGSANPAPNATGKISRVLLRWLMKQAHVVEAANLAPEFRLITLESTEFRQQTWSPGQKIQVAMGSAFVARTFTPIDWDGERGRTRLIGYAHGTGPGAVWLRSAAPGMPCDVFGPRNSLDLNNEVDPVVVLGDETSIGLAHALTHRRSAGSVSCLLEVNAESDARAALTTSVCGSRKSSSACRGTSTWNTWSGGWRRWQPSGLFSS